MKKTPFVTKQQVEEIVKKFPTPFHLYDEAGIRANAQAVKDAFAWNPGFREYFAVKATPNPYLLKILKDYIQLHSTARISVSSHIAVLTATFSRSASASINRGGSYFSRILCNDRKAIVIE